MRIVAGLMSLASIVGLVPTGSDRGMGAGHGPCWELASRTEQLLMAHESDGWPTADNPRSTAFGCGQLIRQHRRAFAPRCHTHPDTVDASASMCLMRAYVTVTYGSTAKALRVRRARGWY